MKQLCKALLFAALLFPLLTFAQSNYKPGYIVTTKGDTVRGLINLREWENNPHNVDFKDKSGVKNYTAGNIRAFGVLNEAYSYYIGNISTDATNISHLSIGRDTSFVTDTVFLRILQKGPNVTLYNYIDDIKTRYFITDNQINLPYELIFRQYHKPDGGVSTHIENGFIAQLYALAQKYNDTDDLKRLIEKADYTGGELESIAKKINKMTIDSKDDGTPSAVTFFIGAGISASTIKPKGTLPFYNAQNTSNINPTLSIGANIYANPNVKQLALRVEVLFTKDSYQSTVDSYYNQPEKPHGHYAFSQYVAALYPQVLINLYNTDNLKFYLDMGITFNFAKNSGNSYTNTYTDVHTENYLTLNKYWVNYPAKAGLVISKKFDISVAYAFSTSLTNNGTSRSVQGGNYSFNLSSVMAGIHYNL